MTWPANENKKTESSVPRIASEAKKIFDKMTGRYIARATFKEASKIASRREARERFSPRVFISCSLQSLSQWGDLNGLQALHKV